MSRTAPIISVVMAVHNGRQFASLAIESILGQTLGDFEFVIVDDGSTDGVSEDLRSYADRDSRVRLVVQNNRGLTKSLNTGLEQAQGIYVARMDADDVADPRRLERQATAFAANSQLILLGSEVELISETGIRLGQKGQATSHPEIREKLLHGDGSALVHPSVMFRRQQALDIGGYDERFTTAQDLDFFLRLSERGTVENHSEVLLSWRQHSTSINRTRSSTWQAMKALAIEKTIERIGSTAYARDLFSTPTAYGFPSSDYELASFASLRRRNKEAALLYWREVVSGPRKMAAFCRLLVALPRIALQAMTFSPNKITDRQATANEGPDTSA